MNVWVRVNLRRKLLRESGHLRRHHAPDALHTAPGMWESNRRKQVRVERDGEIEKRNGRKEVKYITREE